MRQTSIRKVLRTAFAFGLAGVMCIINPAHTLAASPEEEGDYVSEVRISTAKTEDDAKKWLWDNGYEVQDQNLNNGTGKDAVYLGYKTTGDPDKAITDMAVMNMNGGYSASDYEEMMKKQRESVSQLQKSIQTAVKEYRVNYHADSPGAKEGHRIMNQLWEDDSKKGMGDFLLDESVSEDEMVKVLMQGNSLAMNTIYMGLAMGCAETGDDNWLARLSKLGPKKGLSSTYDVNARDFYSNQWDILQNTLLAYKNSQVKLGDSEEKVKEWVDKLGEDKVMEWMEQGEIYEKLAGYSYGDGTLVDFFLRDKKKLKMEELYPLMKALTEGQEEISSFVGIGYLIQVSGSTKKKWEQANELAESIEEGKSSSDAVSIYEGVDRSLFEGGVALTSEAQQKAASKGDASWIRGNLSKEAEKTFYIVMGSAVVTAVVTGLYLLPLLYLKNAAAASSTGMPYLTGKMAVFANFVRAHFSFFSATMKIATVLFWISLGVALIAAGVYVYLEVKNYLHPKYKEIPRILVDEKKDEQGKATYLNYYAVKDQKGEYADLNAWKGLQWNALYTTKDKDAGNPITTDMFCQEGLDGNVADEEYSPVHAFGEKAAYNLNNHCRDDDVNGIYMFFTRNNPAMEYAGGSFGTGAALTVGICGLAGIAIGTLFTKMSLRRRRKKAVQE